MKIHPADVAQEFKSFYFFRAFPEDLLLQISTLTEEQDFKKNDVILKEGETNKNIYFIRSGIAEVSLAGEVVSILQAPGEVIGEISVVTSRPVTTTIKAASDLRCFKINTDNFSYVPPQDQDHFLHLMYRMYSNILSDRLVKTNEKARLFELANRELHQASANLEKMQNKKVLLLESDKKVLNLGKTALGSAGVYVDATTDVAEAAGFAQKNKYDAIVVCDEKLEFFDNNFSADQQTKTLALTQKSTSSLISLDHLNKVNFYMSRNLSDRSSTIKMMLTTMHKVLSGDLFGLEKYLSWGVEVQQHQVKNSSERESLRDNMAAYFKKVGARSTLLDRVNTVGEELLMNAIYDAPVDSHGQFLFNNLSRKTVVALDSHQQSKLRYATDGIYLAISVTDPFGALSKGTLLKYLESNYQGKEIEGHSGKGGAGKGLHQIVENSDLTIFNVKKNDKTEVISLFSVDRNESESTPSFHYFFAD
jgi:CRP-like cAMP-binding protein